MSGPEVLRYTAFSEHPEGGNPAGVVLDAQGLGDARLQEIAAEVGYSETAFLIPSPANPARSPSAGPAADSADGSADSPAHGSADGSATAERGFTVRYFSPLAEVAFCGHATVAAAVALAERHGPGDLVFTTAAGTVPVEVDEQLRATLTSVAAHISPIGAEDLSEALEALGWKPSELDPALPARIAFAGNDHLVLAAASRARLADLHYDFERLRALMTRLGLTTLQLVWRESDAVFHVRDPFPVGGVVEDPATGAAAAAFGGYLRELGLAEPGAVLTLHQGEDMGRPGTLTVALPAAGDSRVRVSGRAVRIG
ncbi:PhzF family phenazine biosynthesis protein [Streptomyces sp. XM4193]|uniref:PhzF family phenazine biosynthesis protein n=1 Tax=Streptomyces sp. XM4193 TaxID=2929782 RepID=UPI001FFAA4A6|nr:PhzF family phenazine biosynthesis isomerase [Streptomyces sp. XM4193]MCK1796156.1 PhzF family phenazine biosynthesis protein [Streptomyces sp. XM4193]